MSLLHCCSKCCSVDVLLCPRRPYVFMGTICLLHMTLYDYQNRLFNSLTFCSDRYGGERYEKRDLQLRVRQRFSELQNEDEGRIPWHVIDAAQSVEAVTNDIVNIVNKVMEGVAQGKPLQKLWSD